MYLWYAFSIYVPFHKFQLRIYWLEIIRISTLYLFFTPMPAPIKERYDVCPRSWVPLVKSLGDFVSKDFWDICSYMNQGRTFLHVRGRKVLKNSKPQVDFTAPWRSEKGCTRMIFRRKGGSVSMVDKVKDSRPSLDATWQGLDTGVRGGWSWYVPSIIIRKTESSPDPSEGRATVAV